MQDGRLPNCKQDMLCNTKRKEVSGDQEVYGKAVLNFVDIISFSAHLFSFKKQKKRKRASSMLLFFIHVNTERLLVSRLWSSTM